MRRALVLAAAVLSAWPAWSQSTQTRTEQASANQIAALKADPDAAVIEDGTVLVFRRARATELPGLCSQEVIRIPPGLTAGPVSIETTFRNVWDARTGRPETGDVSLAEACAGVGDATTKAPDAMTAWLGAYAVDLVRDALASGDPVLRQLCVEGSSQCRDARLLREIVQRDQMIRVAREPCEEADVCLEAIGFFDPYASKIRGMSLFVRLKAAMQRRPDGSYTLAGATLEEFLLEDADD